MPPVLVFDETWLRPGYSQGQLGTFVFVSRAVRHASTTHLDKMETMIHTFKTGSSSVAPEDSSRPLDKKTSSVDVSPAPGADGDPVLKKDGSTQNASAENAPRRRSRPLLTLGDTIHAISEEQARQDALSKILSMEQTEVSVRLDSPLVCV